MNKTEIKNYNLNKTLLGGQSFSWILDNDTYWGIVENKIIKIKEKDGIWEWQTYPENNDWELINKYFRLDMDFENILKKINKDEYMDRAIQKNSNLRLLQQPLEQTIISFLLSSNRNIPSIRKNISTLSQMLGSEIQVEDRTFYTFPTLENIANTSIEKLRETGIGYRG